MNAMAHDLHFYPVILAGGTGSRLHPLTDDIIKALLPVANKPAIFYPLYLLEHSGFSEVMIITIPSYVGAITDYVIEQYPLDPLVQNWRADAPSMAVKIQVVREGIGTADALREVSVHIPTDFIVLTSDVVTECDLSQVLEQHRMRDASVTVVTCMETVQKKDKKTELLEDISVVVPSTQRLLLLESSADIEDQVILSRSLLKHANRLILRRNLRDCHLYVFSHWVLELLQSNQIISSIKAELVPFLVRRQFHLSKNCRQWQVAVGIAHKESKVPLNIPLPAEYRYEKKYQQDADPDIVRCFLWLLSSKTYAKRVHTLELYEQVNKDCLKGLVPSCINIEESPKQKSQGCIIGQRLQCGPQSEIKESVIGDHCTLGQRVKLLSCVVMDHVVIEDDCHLQKCIISSNCHILTGCSLKHCYTASSVTIPANTKAKEESFGKSQNTDFFLSEME